VALPEISDPAALARKVATVAEDFQVLRMKGFVAVAGKPMRLMVQAVGARVAHQYDRAWRADEARNGHLVVIGLKGLDRAAVTRSLAG
jgi:cobalamin biosynthesis protein CobW